MRILMTTTGLRSLISMLLLGFVTTGCLTYRAHAQQSGSEVRPSDIRPEPGQALHIERDTVLLKTQGTTLTAIGHHKLAPATWIRLTPAGAEVVALDAEVEASEPSRSDALGERNPWFFVEIVDSPRREQVGWRGWIHNSAFSPEALEAERERRRAELVETARVCPDRQRAGPKCEVSLSPRQQVEVYECEEFSVGVGAWNDEAQYIFGWIDQQRLASIPCD